MTSTTHTHPHTHGHGVEHDHDHDVVPVSGRSLSTRLRSLMPLLGRHRRLIAVAYLAGALHQLLLLASSGIGAYVVARAAMGAALDQITGWLIVLGCLIVPLVALSIADSTYAHVAAFRALADTRAKVFGAFERLSPGYMLERRSGDLGSAVVSDVEQIELFFAHTLSPLAVATTVPVATTVALGWFHWSLACVLVPVLLLLASVPAWLRRQAERHGHELRDSLSQMSADNTDTFQGLRELVNFGAHAQRLGLLRKQSRRLAEAKSAHGRRSGIEYAATDTIALLGTLVVLVLGAWLVVEGELDRALFPVAVVLAAMAMLPVLKVTEVARELATVASSADRINTLLDAPAPVTDLVSLPPEGPIVPHVRFDAVTFAYRGDLAPAVRDISFEISPGETVALVGHSGAGKSTCANLLLRFWDVTAGSVSVGGHDVRDFPQEDLRRLMTLVPQDTFLFNTSMRENIRLGRADASDDEVEAAARAAQAHEFITTLPNGYDTGAGELGALMSGGQRQRIAIARALLKDAPILVMDEAVSNLDAASEQAVNRAMDEARHGRTTLIIAHRLSTIRTADRIVVLSGGRVVETGTHEELVAAAGAYVDLLASQLEG
ncbi:ABC transporter ATP-binding protein [Solwaraspora sp. WMMD406]|uniref:ABC transporter ATP-binding protein n=1 Tax=Solwaraspora sp. WMMD406 TaxID=3016095 RepID=UPI0024159756|nr:ABC transporter ATP-binding protein [Solwaraspora sp. WMMD406]MDG4764934.1 ABC transporter ATP-binding protein [Solwaraspora sp. WMMD406]